MGKKAGLDLGHLLIDDVTCRVCLREIPHWFGDWGNHSSICFTALLLVKSPQRLTIS